MAAAEPARDNSRAATEAQALGTGIEGQLAAHGWLWARTGRAAAAGKPRLGQGRGCTFGPARPLNSPAWAGRMESANLYVGNPFWVIGGGLLGSFI